MTPDPSIAILKLRSELGAKPMAGLSLDPAGDHFVLRSSKEDGTASSITLSPLEVLTIADKPDESEQSKRFVETAKEHGADDTKTRAIGGLNAPST